MSNNGRITILSRAMNNSVLTPDTYYQQPMIYQQPQHTPQQQQQQNKKDKTDDLKDSLISTEVPEIKLKYVSNTVEVPISCICKDPVPVEINPWREHIQNHNRTRQDHKKEEKKCDVFQAG